MTMVGRILDDEELTAVLADPTVANELAWNESDDDGGRNDDDGLGDWLDLDKNWHGVHFLLTGTEWDVSGPLGQAVLGGRAVGDDDGYGPPRVVEPRTVAQVAGALAAVDIPTLRSHYDPSRMRELDIYPGVWDDGHLPHLLNSVTRLSRFYTEAARRGAAVLLAIQ